MFFTKGLSVPEGPVLLDDQSWLVVEMGPDKGCVTCISADGMNHRILARTGRPNGLAIDRDGYIWVAESEPPALLRMSRDGRYEVFLNECQGEPFLWPNDLAFGPDGMLYLTDSGILTTEYLAAPDPDLLFDGRVYRINTQTGASTIIDRGIRFTNGVAFGPDDHLYVNETMTGNVYVYKFKDRKLTGRREYFGNVLSPEKAEGIKGPDGMKFGADGKLYCTVFNQKDVTVLGRDGQVVQRIATQGRNPTNLAFGPAGSRRIYVTETEFGSMEILNAGTDGLALYR
ncbi:MAG: SMP-30/gluconolactonase/LRE family protein [Desulfobacterales bacterium]|nr:MAG: SMP-30/gluconolactonase/LRE family protein [Desulfobacterales bacterium]